MGRALRTCCAVLSLALLLSQGAAATAGAGAGPRTAAIAATETLAGFTARLSAAAAETATTGAESRLVASCQAVVVSDPDDVDATKGAQTRVSPTWVHTDCWFRDRASGADTPFAERASATGSEAGAVAELAGTMPAGGERDLCMQVRVDVDGVQHEGAVHCARFEATAAGSISPPELTDAPGVDPTALLDPPQVDDPATAAYVRTIEQVGPFQMDYTALGERTTLSGVGSALAGACAVNSKTLPGPTLSMVECLLRNSVTGAEQPVGTGAHASPGGAVVFRVTAPVAGTDQLCVRGSIDHDGARHVGPLRCSRF